VVWVAADPAASGAALVTAGTSTICEIQLRFGTGSQIDLQVPANIELAVVLADLKPYLETYLDKIGSLEELPRSDVGWRLRTSLGTLLDNGQSLAAQEIVNGTALELISEPAGEHFVPRIENVSSAVARESAARFPAATPSTITTMMVWYASAVIAAGLLVLTAQTFIDPSWLHRGILAGVAVAIALAAAVNVKVWKLRAVTDATNLLLIAFAPLTVSLLMPLPDSGWGAPHLLVTAVGVLGLSVVSIAAGRYVPAYTTVCVVALFVAASQVGRWVSLTPGPVTVCLLVVGVVILLGRAEILSQTLAKLPISMFPSGSGQFIGEREAAISEGEKLEPSSVPPDPALLASKVVRANDYLTGILLGCSIVATGLMATVLSIYIGKWNWVLWISGVPLIFAYQVWFYAGRRNVAAILLGVFGPVVVAVFGLSAAHGPWWAAGTAATVAVLALLAPRTVPTEGRAQSPLIRGLRAILGYLVIVAVLLAPVLLLRIPQIVYNRDFGW